MSTATRERMDSMRWLMTVATILLVSTSPVSVGAQEARDQARQLFQNGVGHFEAGEYEEALVIFQRSYELNPALSVLFNIGMCQRALTQYVESIETFNRFLSEGGDQIPADRRAEILNHIAEMRSRLGILQLQVQPAEAEVLLNNEPVPSTRWEALRLRPGAYEIVARAEGYEERREQFDVAEQQVVELTLTLEPLVPPPSEVDSTSSEPPDSAGAEAETIPAEAEVDVSDAQPARSGVHRQWWFWTIIGAVVIGGAATGLALGLSGPGDPGEGDVEVWLP